ncbi:hypothetical protein OZX68_03160 [Streptococcaceae bacterium ESL0729]|nr:hypothetical protein OZX68_03160 [Streptococcaceae bacterium ESL0729]
MKIWTIQKRKVLNEILKYGNYEANFEESLKLEHNKSQLPLYNLLLDSYNKINQKQSKGLIFGLGLSDNMSLKNIDNFKEFKEAMLVLGDAIFSLWQRFLKEDCLILELDLDVPSPREPGNNLIPIDINDYQYIMPPFWQVPPYTEEDLERIINNIMDGRIAASPFPSYIIQYHFPKISKESLCGVYEMFEIDGTQSVEKYQNKVDFINRLK